MRSDKTQKEISLVDVPVEIEYTYYTGCKGTRGDYHEPLEPDDPEEVEINRVIWTTKDINGTSIKIDVTDWINESDNLAENILYGIESDGPDE